MADRAKQVNWDRLMGAVLRALDKAPGGSQVILNDFKDVLADLFECRKERDALLAAARALRSAPHYEYFAARLNIEELSALYALFEAVDPADVRTVETR